MPFKPPNARAKQATANAAQYEDRRGSAQSRGYDAAWRRAAAQHRKRSPLCRYCQVGAFGSPIIRQAGLVDHLYPHRGDQTLFWDRRWWVSSCTPCHSGPKQAAEARGKQAIDDLASKLGLHIKG